MKRFVWIVVLAVIALSVGCEVETPPREIVARYNEANVQVSEHGRGVFLFRNERESFTNMTFAEALGRFLKERPSQRVLSVSVVVGHGDNSYTNEVLVVTEER